MRLGMKRLVVCAMGAVAVSLALVPAIALADEGIPMYRLYNPYTGEHFYTASDTECNEVSAAGWSYEGVGWFAPESGDPVYRVYNSFAGEHHYTLSSAERDSLVAVGWSDEGTGWLSGGDVPLYREYNPNAFACNHNYTTNVDEHSSLVSLGWRDEGIAWYGVAAGYSDAASVAYDNLTGKYGAIGGPHGSAGGLSITATELHISGNLRVEEEGLLRESVGNKDWTFGVNADTVYGFTSGYGFTQQSREAFAHDHQGYNFVSLTIEIENGIVKRVNAHS